MQFADEEMLSLLFQMKITCYVCIQGDGFNYSSVYHVLLSNILLYNASVIWAVVDVLCAGMAIFI